MLAPSAAMICGRPSTQLPSVSGVDSKLGHARYASFSRVVFDSNDLNSGIAGPLAAQGGGQICRPFVLGF